MKDDPILIDDLIKAAKLLPNAATFPSEIVSIPIEDSIMKQQRKLLFKKQKAVFLSPSGDKEEVYWTSGVYFIASKGGK